MKTSKACEDCGAPLAWDLLTGESHDKDLCFGRQFVQIKAENKKLKAAEKFWKDAYFEGREIIGKLWWHHPAIDNDEVRAYYQANLHELAKMRPVSYDGFIGTEADWHYQAWMNKR